MKIKGINIALVIVCVLEILFTVSTFIASWNGIEIPDDLIIYWHITFVAELLACAGIKITNTVKEPIKSDDDEDEEAVG